MCLKEKHVSNIRFNLILMTKASLSSTQVSRNLSIINRLTSTVTAQMVLKEISFSSENKLTVHFYHNFLWKSLSTSQILINFVTHYPQSVCTVRKQTISNYYITHFLAIPHELFSPWMVRRCSLRFQLPSQETARDLDD